MKPETPMETIGTTTDGARAVEASVIIPTYNRRTLLAEALEQLGRQTLPASCFEVVVVVDGSNDGTWEMLRELKTPYRLRAVFQNNAGAGSRVYTSGVSEARNKGAGIAQGRVLVFLDDDVLPRPALLEEHLRFHRQSAPCVVLGQLLPAKDTGKKGWNRWEERIFQRHYVAMSVGLRRPSGWRLYSANFSVGRQSFWDVSGFGQGLGNIRGEDVDLGLRLERRGVRFYFSPEAAAVHRGFRSFVSWRNAAYTLGSRDVLLAKNYQLVQPLIQTLRGYQRCPFITRNLVQLYLQSELVRSATVKALRAVSGALSFLTLHGVAHYGYGALFKLEYWRGIADALGGPAALRARAACPRSVRPPGEREAAHPTDSLGALEELPPSLRAGPEP